MEVEPSLAAQPLRVAPQLACQVQGRVAGPLRVVLVGDRRPEQRHDPIARVLVDRALETVNAVGQDVEEAVEDAVPLLGVDLLRELEGALHIYEQDRHLLALALEGRALRQDLLGQVARRVGADVAGAAAGRE